ncbi:MAG: hypothetical protein JOS17DRAFT_785597 [Linnemannia elongata]|nr:MAG: hypothetical protein JOS17DRAFT_785597 [Linnemannia elongata]
MLPRLTYARPPTIGPRQSERDFPSPPLNSQFWWWANKGRNHDVEGGYTNQFKLYVDGVDIGDLRADSIGFESNCHEYRDWCVTHGDPDEENPVLKFWDYSENGDYHHNVTMIIEGTLWSNLRYRPRGISTHCTDDGLWCVTHDDPESPEMAILHKGYEYRHTTRHPAFWDDNPPVACFQYWGCIIF